MFDADKWYRANDPELTVKIPTGTLAHWRHVGIGPPYHKVGRRVWYKGEDLNRFVLDDCRVERPGQAAEQPAA